MKSMCVAFCCALVIALGVTSASAANGAVVIRGEYFAATADSDGQNVLFFLASTENPFWCVSDAGESTPMRWQWLTTPNSTHWLNKTSDFFIWVYEGNFASIPPGDPDTDEWWANSCQFMATHTPLATGIVKFGLVTNDLWTENEKAITQLLWARGPLHDTAGLCRGDIVQFKFMLQWVIGPGDYRPAECTV